jgi:hypothetical protein
LARPLALRYAGAVNGSCRTRLAALLCLGANLVGAGASAEPASPRDAPFAPGIRERSPGRPRVTLDGLTFPKTLPRSAELERHFKHKLRQAAHRADWGAGRGASIEFRVAVEELEVTEVGGVLKVSCTALGRLPKGKSARSRIDFGGDPRQGQKVLRHVLEIVARGVVTRLAALERERRRAVARGG